MNYGMNPDAEDLHEKIGISVQRMDEIAKKTKELYRTHAHTGLVPFLKSLLDNFKDVELVWASMGAMRMISDTMTPLERTITTMKDQGRDIRNDDANKN